MLSKLQALIEGIYANKIKGAGKTSKTGSGAKSSINTDFEILSDLLSNYCTVVQQKCEWVKKEAFFIETQILKPVDIIIKEAKGMDQNLSQSMEMISQYKKRLGNVEVTKKNFIEAYHNYEQNSMIDEAINKVTSQYNRTLSPTENQGEGGAGGGSTAGFSMTNNYGEDPLRNKFYNKEYEYTTAVELFNKEAPTLLKKNVG